MNGVDLKCLGEIIENIQSRNKKTSLLLRRSIYGIPQVGDLAKSIVKDFGDCILNRLETAIEKAKDKLELKKTIYGEYYLKMLKQVYERLKESEKKEMIMEDLIKKGSIDKKDAELEHSILLGEDGGLYMLLNRISEEEKKLLSSIGKFDMDYLNSVLEGNKLKIGEGAFGKIRMGIGLLPNFLLRGNMIKGEIICLKKTKHNNQKIKNDKKKCSLDDISKSTWNAGHG